MSFDARADGAAAPPGPPTGEACRGIAQAISAIDPQAGLRLAPTQTRHIAACLLCRRTVADIDPTALFAMLALERTPDAFWMGFETRTLARIREAGELDARSLSRWAWLRGRFWPLAAGSAAIGVAAVVLVTSQLQHKTGLEPTASAPPIVGGTDIPPSPPSENRIGGYTPASSGPPGAPMLPLQADSAAAPSPVESVSSATARVISIRVAASTKPSRSQAAPARGAQAPSEESDVVLIVDQGIDI